MSYRDFTREDDMHYRNVSKAFGIPIEDVSPQQRAYAKHICFGCSSEEDALAQLEMFLRIAATLRKAKPKQSP